MNPLQNPSPYPNPVQSIPPKPLSFDEVSNFFSFPLSDAADSLGVCTSVLKKICHDNGLARWPYRKFRAGKSIEEIKKDAARGKKKQLTKMPGIAGERGSELPNKTTSSVQEIPKSRGASQPQGSKNSGTGSLHNVYSSNLIKGFQGNPDEFKYGFPSDGLSTVSYRWWVNDAPDSDETQVSISESHQEKEHQSEDPVNNGGPDGERSENNTDKSNMDAQGAGLLSAVRKRASKEGKAALKLGVYRGNGLNKLDWNKRAVLLQIFKSSLPNEWEHGSS